MGSTFIIHLFLQYLGWLCVLLKRRVIFHDDFPGTLTQTPDYIDCVKRSYFQLALAK